ncbi:MAG: ChbG/HpnK family deacetylase [Thermoanaerobaculia bacterium]
MKRLWINADDFGLTPAVSAGICEAIQQGMVATTTAMVCGDGAIETLQVYAPQLLGRIGLHLQLTDGAPRSPATDMLSLVDKDRRFPRYPSGLLQVDLSEVEHEWEAQLATLCQLGVTPTHLDSHHHVHQAPGIFETYLRFAKRHGLPARGGTPEQCRSLRQSGVPTSDLFIGELFRGRLDCDRLLAVAAAAAQRCPEDGLIELMSHPGRIDDTLYRRSTYVEEREEELATLCNAELPARLLEKDLVLINAAELRSI